MPTPSILVLPRRVNNSWPAGLTKAEVSPSICTPLSPSLFTPHQILYSPALSEWIWLTYGSCFETIHVVSASQLEVLGRWCFPSQEMPRKQEFMVDRGQLVSLFTILLMFFLIFSTHISLCFSCSSQASDIYYHHWLFNYCRDWAVQLYLSVHVWLIPSFNDCNFRCRICPRFLRMQQRKWEKLCWQQEDNVVVTTIQFFGVSYS